MKGSVKSASECSCIFTLQSFLTFQTLYSKLEVKPGFQYRYRYTTSTTSLCPHLLKRHFELYMSLAKERGWEIKSSGHLSQAHSQTSSQVAASQGEQVDRFNESNFHTSLVKFIVANDQVFSLHVFLTCNALIAFRL
jgi:hypothetical protein